MFIMTPAGLSHLSQKDRDESLVIYLDAPESIRRVRMSQRNDADNVERRIAADEKDFSEFENYDIHIDNHEFTIDDVLNSMAEFSKISEDILKHISKPII